MSGGNIDHASIFGDENTGIKIIYTESGNLKLCDKKTGTVTTLADNCDLKPFFANGGKDIVYQSMAVSDSGVIKNYVKKINLQSKGLQTIWEGKNNESLRLDCADGDRIVFTNDTGKFLQNLTTKKANALTDDCVLYGDKALFIKGSDVWLGDLENLIKSDQPVVQPGSTFIVQLTDTHIGARGADNSLKQMVNKILTFTKKPNYVVVTGDITDFGYDSEGLENFNKFLELIKTIGKSRDNSSYASRKS